MANDSLEFVSHLAEGIRVVPCGWQLEEGGTQGPLKVLSLAKPFMQNPNNHRIIFIRWGVGLDGPPGGGCFLQTAEQVKLFFEGWDGLEMDGFFKICPKRQPILGISREGWGLEAGGTERGEEVGEGCRVGRPATSSKVGLAKRLDWRRLRLGSINRSGLRNINGGGLGDESTWHGHMGIGGRRQSGRWSASGEWRNGLRGRNGGIAWLRQCRIWVGKSAHKRLGANNGRGKGVVVHHIGFGGVLLDHRNAGKTALGWGLDYWVEGRVETVDFDVWDRGRDGRYGQTMKLTWSFSCDGMQVLLLYSLHLPTRWTG